MRDHIEIGCLINFISTCGAAPLRPLEAEKWLYNEETKRAVNATNFDPAKDTPTFYKLDSYTIKLCERYDDYLFLRSEWSFKTPQCKNTPHASQKPIIPPDAN